MATTASLPHKVCETCGSEVDEGEGGKLEISRRGLSETYHFCWHCLPPPPPGNLYLERWTR